MRTRRALLIALLALCALSSQAIAAGGLPKVLTQLTPAFALRPAVIGYTGDGTGVIGGPHGTGPRHLGHLRWTTYNRHDGLAVGLVWLDDCVPDCARGTFTPHTVHVRVSEPTHGHFRLLTLRYRYHGHNYVDRRVALRSSGGSGPAFWSYAICGLASGPRC
jgi:hypothetical protein